MDDENAKIKIDFLIIGSGASGLTTALHLAELGHVAVVTKKEIEDASTTCAQGGIACVLGSEDSFDEHISDTLKVGSDLCKKNVVSSIIKNGPEAVTNLISRGAKFTTRGDMGELTDKDKFDLGREGGHTKRRVLHAGDITGIELERTLKNAVNSNPNITIYEHHIAIDLITTEKLGWEQEENRVLGAYVLDIHNKKVVTFNASVTIVATGGAGKVYLYSSNPDVACGGGVAMCYRANTKIANMEFYQFHPTILYNEKVKSFLISEAVRGEGAILKIYDSDNNLIAFMENYHELKDLAPRDVVARAIDNEMKKSGQDCVFLDIRHRSKEYILKRFPNIYAKCKEAGIEMDKDLIPVVPAAHYCCGGVQTDINGFTGITGLYAIGETACIGLHGANRLASNSLLENLVIPKFAYNDIKSKLSVLKSYSPSAKIPHWTSGDATNSDELVVISHNWDEIRRFMWDYVGIVRTAKRLERAKSRIKNIRREIEKYYWDFLVTPDLIELRNIASVAEIIIDSAISRKESRGLHFNSDYPNKNPKFDFIDTIIQHS
jgi:L-aspartate oxidase